MLSLSDCEKSDPRRAPRRRAGNRAAQWRRTTCAPTRARAAYPVGRAIFIFSSRWTLACFSVLMGTAGYIDRCSVGLFGQPFSSRNWMGSGILLRLRSGFRGVHRRLRAAGTRYFDEVATDNCTDSSRVVRTKKMAPRKFTQEISVRNSCFASSRNR
jgi:hypothetical protein